MQRPRVLVRMLEGGRVTLEDTKAALEADPAKFIGAYRKEVDVPQR